MLKGFPMKWLIVAVASLTLAVACGGDPTATPRPATSAPVPTPIDTAAIVQQAVQEALTAAEKALDEATAAAAKAREADAAAAQAAVAKAMTAAEKAAADAQKAAVAEALAAAEKQLADAEIAAAKARDAAAAAAAATAAATAAAAAAAAAAPVAFDAEAYFSGKTIRFVSISPPGGGTDTQARVIAARFGQFLPGNPRMVVSDIPRVAGYNYMHQAEPDGFTIMYKASPGLERQLEPDAKFKIHDFEIVASIGLAPQGWVASDKAPYDTLAEAIAAGPGGAPLIMAESVAGEKNLLGGPLTASFLCDRLQMPCKMLRVAEAGTNSQLLMMERGEINMNLRGALWTNLFALRPGQVADGTWKILGIAGPPDLPFIQNPEKTVEVVNAYEYLAEKDRADYALVAYPSTLFIKAMATPPDMPEHILNVYREAMANAIADDTFADALSRVAGFDVRLTYLPGEKIQPVLRETSITYLENQPRIKELQKQLFKYWQ